MRKTSLLAVSMTGLVLLVGALDASAELRMDKGRRGQSGGARLLLEPATGEPVGAEPSALEPMIWGTRGDGERKLETLNPDGDRNGDLWPLVAESVTHPQEPWVVWSRFNGADYDLAWSRWQQGAWLPIRGVESIARPGDDLDPDLGFDAAGRPYLVFWRERAGVGEVLLSVYLQSRWMTPVVISLPGTDARYPAITGQWNRTLEVQYETPAGPLSQMLLFDAPPDTITDDINPQLHVRLKGEPVEVRPN